MYQLRRLSLAVLVWLTAAMTLVASTPHFSCRCPDGRVKPFCFGLPSKKAMCCCNGSCCAPDVECGKTCCSNQNAPARSCCCQHTGQGHAKSANTGTFARAACCTKTLVPQESRSLSRPESKVAKDLSFGALLTAEAKPRQSFVTAIHRLRQDHERPPPTDLVVTLQHFLI
jgi:hypothetical protein